jgi:hypothetical protein
VVEVMVVIVVFPHQVQDYQEHQTAVVVAVAVATILQVVVMEVQELQ